SEFLIPVLCCCCGIVPRQLIDVNTRFSSHDSYVIKAKSYTRAKEDSDFNTKLAQAFRNFGQQQNVTLKSRETKFVTLTSKQGVEEYQLQVTPSDFATAQKDLLFATELLERHKAAVAKQSSNAVLTNFTKDASAICSGSQSTPNTLLLNIDNKTDMSFNHTELIPLQLFEEDTGLTYTLQLYPSLHNRAVNVGAYKWDEQDSKLLVPLYKESQEKYDNGSLTKKKFYTNIMKKLKEAGYIFTMQQCITKMDSFKRSYRKVKDHNAQSGNDPKFYEFYDLLDEMFHKKPWITPLSKAGSNVPMDMDEADDDCKLKSKRRKLSNETEQYYKQCLEEKRLRRKAHARYMEEKLIILRNIANHLPKKKD
ncbi:hypothetical protein TSAR_016833, partial [Trichomalopsis sarcophagae]